MISFFEMNYCVVKAIQNLLVSCASQYTTHSGPSVKALNFLSTPDILTLTYLFLFCVPAIAYSCITLEEAKAIKVLHGCTLSLAFITLLCSVYVHIYVPLSQCHSTKSTILSKSISRGKRMWDGHTLFTRSLHTNRKRSYY